jgi:farnesyl-diphosphate farnesyltransferase
VSQGLPLRAILRRVSRSFYLTLWLLPPATRETVALAYLLARAADTVADTRLLAVADRGRLLGELREVFDGARVGEARGATLEALRGLTRSEDVTPGEAALLEELGACLALFDGLAPPEQGLVRRVLDTLTDGMREDLERFPGESSDELRALETRAELRAYTYAVAGCVGEFWADLHAARLPSCARVDRAGWARDGVALGRALQLTNVLRDVHRDLSHGRCYLPREDLAAHGLEPTDLLAPATWPRLRPLYEDLVRAGLVDAAAGLRHVLATPSREVWVRLAAVLPLLLAVRTLGVVLAGNPLDPAARRKVTRATVYGTLARGFAAARDDRALVRLYRQALREAGLARLA